MYNFALAFVICALVCVIGDFISKLSKAWIPSVFITAVILLIGYWTFIPKNLIADAGLLQLGGSVGIYFCIVHIGTMLSIRQLLSQWKTVIICLIGLAGMCFLCYFICPLFMEKTLTIVGLPPLTGGIVAATMMENEAMNRGMELAAIFAISMYCIQGFAGYPLTTICLHKEGKQLLADYRNHKNKIPTLSSDETKITDENHKKLIPEIPSKYNSPTLLLAKTAFTVWLSIVIGNFTGINGAIVTLILSVLLTSLGFLDSDILNKAGSYGFLSFCLTLYIFDGLKNCTPTMLMQILGPMLILVIIGVAGLWIASFIMAKITKTSVSMAYATCLTALYGFPFNVIMTESVCEALTKDENEQQYLKDKMLPPMLVGGFTTVTIASVVIAGIFIKLL